MLFLFLRIRGTEIMLLFTFMTTAYKGGNVKSLSRYMEDIDYVDDLLYDIAQVFDKNTDLLDMTLEEIKNMYDLAHTLYTIYGDEEVLGRGNLSYKLMLSDFINAMIFNNTALEKVVTSVDERDDYIHKLVKMGYTIIDLWNADVFNGKGVVK